MLQQYDNRAFEAHGLDSEKGRYDDGDLNKSQDVSYPHLHIYPSYIQKCGHDATPRLKQDRGRYILGLAVIATVIVAAVVVVVIVVFTRDSRPMSMDVHPTNTMSTSASTMPTKNMSTSASPTSHTLPTTSTQEHTVTAKDFTTDFPETKTEISSSSEGFERRSSTVSTATSSPIFQGCGYRPMLEPAPHTRIVGGSTAATGTWPWIGSLQNSHGHICGATLVDHRFAITAAHCLEDESVNELLVVFGTNSNNISELSPSKVTVSVSEIFVDPSYDSAGHDYDFAVLKLQESIMYSQHIFPACLPLRNLTLVEGTVCSIAGWGKLHPNGEYPVELLEAQVPIVSPEVCEDYVSDPLTERMFCAGYEVGGIDACKGDSGGPLVCQLEDSKWYLYGIVSWGYSCALPRLPGFYAKVNEFYDVLRQWTDIDP